MEKTRDIFNLLLNVSSKIVDNENIKNQLVDLINNTKTEIEPYGSEIITKTLTALILNITKIFKPDISLTTIESYNKTRDIFDSLSNIPKSNTIYIASEKDILSNELPNTNGFYLYGRIDTIIVYNNTIYLVDYKTTKNPIYLKLYNKDTSIENQLLMYAYILKNKDSETNIFDISDISNYKIYYMYNIIYTQNLQDPDTILSYQKYDDTAIYQFKVNIINFIKMYLIKPFMENGQFKNNIFSINDDLLYVTSGLLNKSYHNECSFQPVCEYSKNISEEIKNISTPESEEIPISTTSTISSQYIRKVPDRIGIINLSYYDCVVSVYFGQKESVIENKDNAVSLNQSGQIIYDIKGEINRSIFSISFSNVNHMLEVYRYIRAQQILFNIIPIYNNFLAKSFLPYNIYSNYYVKILGSKLVSKNVLNSISLMEPSIGEDGIYYSSIYSMVPVYCNVNSVKIQSIYGQTYGYTIELDLSKVSMEMLNKYDFQFAGDVATLKKILNIQQEVRGFQNPYWKIFSELYSREVDNESIDKSYRIKE